MTNKKIVQVEAFSLLEFTQAASKLVSEGFQFMNTNAEAPQQMGSVYRAVLQRGYGFKAPSEPVVGIREIDPAVYGVADSPVASPEAVYATLETKEGEGTGVASEAAVEASEGQDQGQRKRGRPFKN